MVSDLFSATQKNELNTSIDKLKIMLTDIKKAAKQLFNSASKTKIITGHKMCELDIINNQNECRSDIAESFDGILPDAVDLLTNSIAQATRCESATEAENISASNELVDLLKTYVQTVMGDLEDVQPAFEKLKAELQQLKNAPKAA